MNWTPIVLTLKLAGLTALILVAVGMPIAYWLTYSRWRWKFLAESVVALPLVLPPTVLGFYVLVAVGPKSPLGRGAPLRVRPLQPAVCRPALRVCLWICGSEAG